MMMIKVDKGGGGVSQVRREGVCDWKSGRKVYQFPLVETGVSMMGSRENKGLANGPEAEG